MGRQRLLTLLAALGLVLFLAPAAAAHGEMEPGSSIWESTFVAQLSAAAAGALGYAAMVWEPGAHRRRRDP